MFRYVDTFCGIGGFSQAAHRVGGSLVAACEIHPEVRKLYAMNYGITPHDDIRTMTPAPPGRVHILCGGFPCQPFSAAGGRLGMQTENGRLFFALLRYAVASKIPCLLLENVVGLLNIEYGSTFEEFQKVLRESGYKVSYAVLNSYDFGVPQVRKRLYIVAHRERKFDFAPLQQHACRTRHVLGDVLDADLERCRALEFKTGFSLPPRTTPSGFLRCDDPPSSDQTHRVYHPDGPIATMISSNPTKIYDPRLGIARKMTPREMLSCQGFPRSFVYPEDASHSFMAHVCGNAVSVPVIEAILRELLRQNLLPKTQNGV